MRTQRLPALVLALTLAVLLGTPGSPPAFGKELRPVVILTTSLGVFKLELQADRAPITVENFLHYVDGGFYDKTIFHRVIPDFMVQGGGMNADMKPKKTEPSIVNESKNGLTNDRGTVAMARTSDPNSATAQFFINLKDNDFLNFGKRDAGYAVFGRVLEGMDVVEKIAAVKTGTKAGQRDVPIEPVLLWSAKRE